MVDETQRVRTDEDSGQQETDQRRDAQPVHEDHHRNRDGDENNEVTQQRNAWLHATKVVAGAPHDKPWRPPPDARAATTTGLTKRRQLLLRFAQCRRDYPELLA